MLLTIILFFYN